MTAAKIDKAQQDPVKEGTPVANGKQEAEGSPQHLAFLDGLRGLAALYVVLHHESMEEYVVGSGLMQRAFAFSLRYGHYAVDVFIVLSGFCLMLPVCRAGGLLSGGPQRFLKRRATRILPTYFAALSVCLILIWAALGAKTMTHWDETLPVTKQDFWAHVLLLQDLFPISNHRINYAMWSISVEWRIYFLFPLLVFAARKFGTVKVTVAACMASYALLIPLKWLPLNSDAYGASPAYIGLFCIGMCACDYSLGKLSGTEINRTRMLVGLSLGFILLAGLSVSRYSTELQAISLLVGILAGALMVALGRGFLPSLHRVLSWKPIALLGVFGYSLYLFHPPLIHMIWLWVVHPLGFGSAKEQLLLFAATPLVVTACYLCFLLFERPILRSRKAKG